MNSGRYGGTYRNMIGILSVVVRVNRSVPGLTVTGISSVIILLCLCRQCFSHLGQGAKIKMGKEDDAMMKFLYQTRTEP